MRWTGPSSGGRGPARPGEALDVRLCVGEPKRCWAVLACWAWGRSAHLILVLDCRSRLAIRTLSQRSNDAQSVVAALATVGACKGPGHNDTLNASCRLSGALPLSAQSDTLPAPSRRCPTWDRRSCSPPAIASRQLSRAGAGAWSRDHASRPANMIYHASEDHGCGLKGRAREENRQSTTYHRRRDPGIQQPHVRVRFLL